MKVIEYGKENEKVAIFIHGGGLSWWSFRAVAEKLQNEYHVVLPVLDGHADSDSHFVSIADNARELIEYISERWGNRVFLIAGLSLGAQILLEILAQKSDICEYAIIESALIKPMKLFNTFIAPSISISYKLIKKPWFAKLQFKELKLPPELFEEYYKDSCKISKTDMISFLKANASYTPKKELGLTKAKCLILAGGKENRGILESAQELTQIIPTNECIIFPELYHGQASISYPDMYVDVLHKFIETKGIS
ncbi:alpha/beta fold hydrolase [Enterococcus sp. LJL99]